MDSKSTRVTLLKSNMSLGARFGTSLYSRADGFPSLSNGEEFLHLCLEIRSCIKSLSECWSNSESATSKCCAQFNGTRTAVKGSSIDACTYHADGKAWAACIQGSVSSSQTSCSSSGSVSGGSGGSPSSGSRTASSGGILVLGLLLSGLLLS
ncbi:hypothetical protein C8R43DRAFT_11508 [Mycena crocata]|nr:hypothetical protein C8R43DRAFT_11508 [Mycena crocata]